jgi:hypothetical protein
MKIISAEGANKNSAVEPEPQGAETFGQSRSWYSEVLAPGQTKVVCKNHNSY